MKAGEEVLVTERGLPMAKLVSTLGSGPLPDHFIEMEKQGLIKRGARMLSKQFWELPRPLDPTGAVRKTLSQEGEEGWRDSGMILMTIKKDSLFSP